MLLEKIKHLCKNTAVDALGINFTHYDPKTFQLKLNMKVSANAVQPFRYLHGGVTCVLTETAASVAAQLILDEKLDLIAFGQEINTSHLRSVKEGETIEAVTELIHSSSTSQVWEVKVTNEQKAMVAITRITMAIRKKRI